jgi:hypothetical protein
MTVNDDSDVRGTVMAPVMLVGHYLTEFRGTDFFLRSSQLLSYMNFLTF